MGRPRKDKDKDKKVTSIRIDDMDKEFLLTRFGSVQGGVDFLMYILGTMSDEEIGGAKNVMEFRRSQQQ